MAASLCMREAWACNAPPAGTPAAPPAHAVKRNAATPKAARLRKNALFTRFPPI